MATVTASSHFVSRTSLFNNHGASSASDLSQITLKGQSMTHCGLRSFNMVDRLQRRSQAKPVSAKSSKQNASKAKPSGKIVCETGMSVIFIGAEVGPWSKTGGLGDVLGGLPPALAARGHRVMTICPRYDQYEDAWDTCVVVQIKVGDKVENVRFFHCYKRGVDRVFVDHPIFLAKAIWALGNVAGESRYRDLVLECRVLQPLLTLLLYPDTMLSTRRIGAWTLLNLICGTPRLTFNEAMMKPTIELLLHSNDEDILKYVCLALWHLTEGSEDGIQSVIDAGFVPKLVEILQHPSLDVLSPALRTIGSIVSGDNQQTQSVITCGALPILANLLTRNYENNMIKKVTCWTISNITAGTKEQIQSVIDANLIPTLVNLAQNAEFGMAKEAAWVISNVTKRASNDQIKYMVEKSCIKPLCDILLCQDIRTILKCLDGLENILKAGEAEKNEGDVNYYCEVIEDVEGLDKIVNLQDHDSNEIYDKALKILETNWEEDDDEETQEHPS